MATNRRILVYPKCTGPLCVIAIIEQTEVIRKISKHLGLWGKRRKPLPRANESPELYDAYEVAGYFPTPEVDMADPCLPLRRKSLNGVYRNSGHAHP